MPKFPSDLATERERQLTTARGDQTTGLTIKKITAKTVDENPAAGCQRCLFRKEI